MGCPQSDFNMLLTVALVNVTIAAWTALLPQYAFIFFMAAFLYYYVAVLMPEPTCKWPKRYYAIYAASGIASISAYAYAMNAAKHAALSGGGAVFGHVLSPREYAAWMDIQLLAILFTAQVALLAYFEALKNMLSVKEYQRRWPAEPPHRATGRD